MSHKTRGPDEIDVHVGQRLRLARRSRNMSQQQLAEALGVSFQQVQKYERAANRVAASRLRLCAQVLGVTVAWFYEGLDEEQSGDDLDLATRQFANSPSGQALLHAAMRLPEKVLVAHVTLMNLHPVGDGVVVDIHRPLPGALRLHA